MQTEPIQKSERLSALPDAVRVQYQGWPQLDRNVGPRLEALVGDTISFVTMLTGVPIDFQLLRQPADPEAVADDPNDDGVIATTKRAIRAKSNALAGGRFSPSRAGLYVIRISLFNTWHRDVAVLAFRPEALDRLVYPPSMAPQRRKRLQHIVQDDRITPESAIAALEGPPDGYHGISGVLLGAPNASTAPYLDPSKYQ